MEIQFSKKKISYINYLPVWNFLLILLLPPQTIMGPATGSLNRKNLNFLVKFFSVLGIKIFLFRYKKIIFSHNFFKNLVPKNRIKDCYFNFLLFNFKKKKLKKKGNLILFFT